MQLISLDLRTLQAFFHCLHFTPQADGTPEGAGEKKSREKTVRFILPLRVDVFYIWGFPFEEMQDFRQTLFQMIYFRQQGARVLPSLLCFLLQTDIYREVIAEGGAFEFCPQLFPEYMITGHEQTLGVRANIAPEHARIFRFIEANPDIFTGFFHHNLEGNILPKLRMLEKFGFYRRLTDTVESCGAHSPRVSGIPLRERGAMTHTAPHP